ncbi:MAG: LysE family transporter [Anaerolineae bacterium]|jgi:threonine/homoserine/homoserine lactone efflux protein|nr:LysE family transporter [Anaerolineae bacterium]MBT7684218.1 LysE family transporter [Candidatus Neomarinimicrobiota bacterium]MBT4309915.1 LysE family transporter [Anaerolineae bacterium]MBT4457835.1 LysE family transporter [Anaerolineae bacterium]MBT4841826.1 LysE family transporter [Anaerolineae bacterium]
MTFSLLLQGIVIGFSIAAPVGPIGVLCIRRTLAKGRIAGLISGLGAATADAVYGCIAGFGLTFISQFLVDQQNLLRLVGGAFLLYLGIKTFFSKDSEKKIENNDKGLSSAYLTTFFLTLTNPLTILSFVAIFAGMGIVNTTGNYASALMLVLGVFIGSMLWWSLLSGGASFFQKKIDAQGLTWINKISGVIITGFGVVALLGFLTAT